MNVLLTKTMLLAMILCFNIGLGSSPGYAASRAPKAVKGVVDLTGWNFETDGIADLSGEYAFYWRQHLSPTDFAAAKVPQPTRFMPVPSYWNMHAVDDAALPGDGYATYRLTVLMQPPSEPLAMKILEVATAYRLYINSERVVSVGQIGTDRTHTVPQLGPRIVAFDPAETRLEIILQVSNFHHRRGGAWQVITLGREQDIRGLNARKHIIDLFILGSIFIMALYHAGLYIFRSKDQAPLYFSIFGFLIALRLLTTEERYLLALMPGITWEVLLKLEYLAFYLAVPVFILYVRTMIPEISKRLVQTIVIIGMAFSAAVIFTPARFFSHTLNSYQVVTLAAMLYVGYLFIRIPMGRSIEKIVFLSGFIILGAAVVNDILHVGRVIHTAFLTPTGFFCFILSQVMLLSYRSSQTLTQVETQSEELRNALESYRQEILERMETQEALHQSEKKYRTIVNSIEDGYYEVDIEGNLTFFNDSLCKILGYSREELMGMGYRNYIRQDTAQKVVETVNQVQKTGTAAKALDWETICKDGDCKSIEASVSLIQDGEGNAIGFRGVARDITERKKAEEQAKLHQKQLIQASKMVALGTLVSGVAHEINNPNNFIMLNTPIFKEAWKDAVPLLDRYYQENGDFILAGMPYSEMRKNVPVLLSGISDGAQRIKQIVGDLKNYVRGDLADLSQSVDINAVIESAVSLVTNMINKSTHHFKVLSGQNLPHVRGNYQRLEQVMINLIQNACQSLTDKRNGIKVSTLHDAGNATIEITIQDEGTGIAGETLPHITDPFFTTRHDSGGVGLGLSISERIVEEHGGSLNFTSDTGQGTTVTIVLPTEEHPNLGKKA